MSIERQKEALQEAAKIAKSMVCDPTPWKPIEKIEGVKNDKGKLRVGLTLKMSAFKELAKVLDFGAKKYAPDNYKYVKGWRWRYFDAASRHMIAWISGEKLDPETNYPHLAHAIASLMMLLSNELDEMPHGDDE